MKRKNMEPCPETSRSYVEEEQEVPLALVVEASEKPVYDFPVEILENILQHITEKSDLLNMRFVSTKFNAIITQTPAFREKLIFVINMSYSFPQPLIDQMQFFMDTKHPDTEIRVLLSTKVMQKKMVKFWQELGPTITSLVLVKQRISEKSIDLLLGNSPNIRSLKLLECDCDVDPVVINLYNMYKVIMYKRLIKLDLSHSKPDEDFKQFLDQATPRLRHFISSNDCEYTILANRCKGFVNLADHYNIDRLLDKVIESETQFETLRIADVNTTYSAPQMLHTLYAQKRLKYLEMPVYSTELLRSAVCKSRHLETLKLFMVDGPPVLRSKIIRTNTLKELVIIYMYGGHMYNAVKFGSKVYPKMEKLVMAIAHLYPVEVDKTVLSVSTKMPHLRELYIRVCNWENLQLIINLFPNLLLLRVTICNDTTRTKSITGNELYENMVKPLSKLEHLSIGVINDYLYSEFQYSFKFNLQFESLKEFRLNSFKHFTDEALTGFFIDNPFIEILEFGKSYRVDDNYMWFITKTLKNLEMLDIRLLDAITEKSIDHIVTNCKNLNTLYLTDTMFIKNIEKLKMVPGLRCQCFGNM